MLLHPYAHPLEEFIKDSVSDAVQVITDKGFRKRSKSVPNRMKPQLT